MEGAASLLAGQRGSFAAETTVTVAARRDRLCRLEAMIRAFETRFIAAIDKDFAGRARQETILAEVVPTLAAIREAGAALPRWMRSDRRRVALPFRPGRAWVQRAPLGVIGIVSPWNYPLLLSLSPLAGVLAGGNRALLKPSELVPAFASCLNEAIRSVFDPAEIAVIEGGAEVSREFCRLPLDHLLFTGSRAVGRLVMQAAAEHLTPVTLELGGKSPALVTETTDLARAAATLAQAKFFNAGQTCLAPDYALVPAAMAARFAGEVIAAAERLYPLIIGNADYTSVINDDVVARLDAAVSEAAASGGRVLRHRAPSGGRRYAPTVVLNPPLDGALMTREIFGPVLPVISYATRQEAVRHIADRPAPLALYIFAGSRTEEEAILGATRSGGVTIGAAMLHYLQEDLPFGGVGESGFGAYHGEEGFRRFTHARAVYRPGRFNQTGRLTAPYGRLSAVLLQWLKGKPAREAAAIIKRIAARSEQA